MRSIKLKWLAWFLLYFALRICGIITFRYDFQVGRFQHSFVALTYSCSVVVAYFLTHSRYEAEYLEVSGPLYNNDLIVETIRYNFRFSSVAFFLVYSFQIWRRKEIVRFLNSGLGLLEQLPGTHLNTKHLDMLLLGMFISSFGFLFDGAGISNGWVEISVKALMPFYTKFIFGATWTLLTSLAVRAIRVLNVQIESIQPLGAGDNLNQNFQLYFQLFRLIQTLGSLSSVISVVQIVRSFIGLATLVSSNYRFSKHEIIIFF
jgi:hypothetical protein